MAGGLDDRDPFGLTANPDGYVPTAAIEQVMHEAMAALDAGRVPVVAGPTGLGKTLVLQLLARARADRSRPLYIPFCTLGPSELATLAVGLLDSAVQEDPEHQLLEEARKISARGQSLLLLVDDAAALPGETAAQLAHWLNASGGTLQIALAGLPGPALRHARDAFGDRAQELLLVEGLKPEEVPGYVHSRLDAAMADREVRVAFDDSALGQLARISEGNPRRVNLAAQAIVRNVRSQSAAQDPERPGVPSTAQDLVNVGEYRFVRGRFVDPDSGEAIAEADAIPHFDETAPPSARPSLVLAAAPPEAPRAEPEAPPMVEPVAPPVAEPEPELPPEPDLPPPTEPAPEKRGTFEVFNRDLPPEEALQPPRTREVRIPLPSPSAMRWIAAGVALLLFGAGVYTQVGNEEPRVATVQETRPPARTAARPIAPVKPAPVAPAEDIAPLAPVDEIAAVEPTPAEESAAPESVAEPVTPEPEPAPIAEKPQAEPEPALIAEKPQPEPEPALIAEKPQAEPEPAPIAEKPQAEPEPAPIADASKPEPEPAPIADASKPEPEPGPIAPPPAETIAVAINATPWAIIEVDGKEIGETPLAGVQLTTGRHRFKARMPDGTSRERVIRIDASKTTVVFE